MRLLRANALEAVHASRIDAKKFDKGVKGILLTCPLWLQIYVSIVHRSIKTCYSKLFTYDVLLIFPRFFDKFKHDILRHLCYKGALHDLIKIHDRFEWSKIDVRSNGNYAFRWACTHGHLDVAKWLYTVFQLTVDDARSFNNYAFRYACANGHQNVCDWLVATFGETVKNLNPGIKNDR